MTGKGQKRKTKAETAQEELDAEEARDRLLALRARQNQVNELEAMLKAAESVVRKIRDRLKHAKWDMSHLLTVENRRANAEAKEKESGQQAGGLDGHPAAEGHTGRAPGVDVAHQ